MNGNQITLSWQLGCILSLFWCNGMKITKYIFVVKLRQIIRKSEQNYIYLEFFNTNLEFKGIEKQWLPTGINWNLTQIKFAQQIMAETCWQNPPPPLRGQRTSTFDHLLW
jgi:hypothetical protein